MSRSEPVPLIRATSPGRGAAPSGGWAGLVPELLVSDIHVSVAFWCDVLGFTVAYDRPAAGFAYLQRGAVQVMLCARNGSWEPGAMEYPFGRGINLQMRVASITPLLTALEAAAWPLYEAPEDSWYRVGDHEAGQREFLVMDPDGFLLRFAEGLGTRPPTQR